MPVAAAGKVPHVLLGGGGLAFLGLESSKEEGLTALKRARNRQGVGRLVLRAAHTQWYLTFFYFLDGNLSTSERKKKNQPSFGEKKKNVFSNPSFFRLSHVM